MPVFHETSAADFPPGDPNSRTEFTDIFPAQQAKSPLAEYRVLSATAGMRISPIWLGAMSIGDQWTGLMSGGLNQEQSEKYLDTFFEAGGNAIDTANIYQDEQSEHIIGEWMEKRGNRNDLVIATKYTGYSKNRNAATYPGIGVNYSGNHKKSLHVVVEEQLKRLRTDYIDLLYVHWWEHSTSIPELMQSLNDLVRSGKVLYLGISDTPAWIVSQANEYARNHGFATFSVYQGLWNLSARDIERDIIPMARANGMSLAAWGVLGQGRFKTPEELEKRGRLRGGATPSPAELKVSQALKEVAEEIGGDTHLTHVAMAWTRQTYIHTFPILGGTSIDQLQSNIRGLKLKLTDAQLKKLDEASPFDPGFPNNTFGTDPKFLENHKPALPFFTTAGQVQYLPWA